MRHVVKRARLCTTSAGYPLCGVRVRVGILHLTTQGCAVVKSMRLTALSIPCMMLLDVPVLKCFHITVVRRVSVLSLGRQRAVSASVIRYTVAPRRSVICSQALCGRILRRVR